MKKHSVTNSEVYLGDCMDLMSQYPEKYFDLAVVDPPYGIGVNHNIGRRKGDKPSDYKPALWDKYAPEKCYFDKLFRVSKHVVVWGANHFISRMPYDSSCWLVWDKGFSQDVSFAQFELAWTSFSGTCKKFDKRPLDPARIHPTQKPVALYDWIFARYAQKGQKILDTHLGSQSSRIAADKAGLIFTGIEKDLDYFNDGNKRFELYKAQGRIEFPE